MTDKPNAVEGLDQKSQETADKDAKPGTKGLGPSPIWRMIEAQLFQLTGAAGYPNRDLSHHYTDKILADLDAAGLEIVLRASHPRGKPTIHELEKILAEEDGGNVRIKPDGSVVIQNADFDPTTWKPEPQPKKIPVEGKVS